MAWTLSELPVLLVRPEDAAIALGIGRTKVYELMRASVLLMRPRRIPDFPSSRGTYRQPTRPLGRLTLAL